MCPPNLQNEMNVEGKRWWLVKPYKTMKKLETMFQNLLYDTRTPSYRQVNA